MTEATIGTPVMQKCVGNYNGSNLPWMGWSDSDRNNWNFDSSGGSPGSPCNGSSPWFGTTNYNSWGNNMTSVQNWTNRALYLYLQQNGNGPTLTVMPGSYDSNLNDVGWNDVVNSSMLDSNPFTCDSFFAHSEPNMTSNFYGANYGGAAAQINLLSNVTNSDGRKCIDRVRLQSCLNNRISGSLLDPNKVIMGSPVINSEVVTGYDYDNGGSTACNLLIQNYCAIGDNIEGSVCQSIYNDQSDPLFVGPMILSPVLKNYCTGSNLLQPICTAFCQLKDINCDIPIAAACASEGSAGISNGSPYQNLCACWTTPMSQTACDQLSAQYPGANISCNMSLPQCNNPLCSSATAMKPWSVKTGQDGQCPNTLQCIQSITVNNDGTVGAVTISANQDCQQITNNNTPPPSAGHAPTISTPPASTPTPVSTPASTTLQKIENMSTTTKIIIIVIIFLILGCCFVIAAGGTLLLF